VEFTIAQSVDEALTALAAGARPVAGGSDLVVGARHGKAPLPDSVVAIDRIEELGGVNETADGLRVGALVTHAELMASPTIISKATGLADAAALVGSPATRNVGTLGGNVMNGSPAMDTGAPLMVLGASVHLRSATGERAVPISELWTGPGKTSAAADELCTEITIPDAPERSGSAYVRLEYRRAMEIAVVGAAAAVTLDASGEVDSIRVALTAVAPTIIEVTGIDAVADVQAAASAQATPISDLRASDRYRAHTIGVMATRAVDAAARRAAGESIAVPVNRALGVGAAGAA